MYSVSSKPKTFLIFCIITLYFFSRPCDSKSEVSFRIIPEFPYQNEEFYLIEKELINTPKNIKFFVNMGSKTDRPNPSKLNFSCDENRYKNLSNLLKKSKVPVFITPGANVYWNCNKTPQKKPFQKNPLWKKYFSEFEKNWKFDFSLQRQNEQKENFSFYLENTLFIGINFFEKRGRNDITYNKIITNNISWIKQNLKQRKEKIGLLVIFAHNFAGIGKKNIDYFACGGIQIDSWEKQKHYKFFSNQFINLAKNFKKPILYIHDNSHCFLYDTPYIEAKNIKRLIVDRVSNSPLIQIQAKGSKFLIEERKNQKTSLFIKEANHGDVWSQYFLGLERLKLGDYSGAIKLLTKASQNNFLPAKSKLAQTKILYEKNYIETFKFIKSILKNNDFKNDFKNKIASNSYEKKIVEFKQEIIRKSTYEIYLMLGVIHQNMTPKNYKKSIEYYKKASEEIGNAHYNIASIYYNGLLDGRRNYKKARENCIKGAKVGVILCKFMLGWINYKGLGIKQDYKKAAEWFHASTKLPASSYNLGTLYFLGLGVPKDRDKAIKYFKKAAMLGNKEAKRVLKSLGANK